VRSWSNLEYCPVVGQEDRPVVVPLFDVVMPGCWPVFSCFGEAPEKPSLELTCTCYSKLFKVGS
jgi:hypothetical protein